MNDETKPIMVMNPYTNKLMNVEPLFRFIRTHDDGVLLFDELIRHLIINVDNESCDYVLQHFYGKQGMFFYLYDMRDFFTEIAECQISMPKKGCEG